ncbi:MAG: phosphoribosyl-ATP pyrophosphatase [Cryomorphaceae bacterium]
MQKAGKDTLKHVIEAKDENRDLFLGEAADLLFHYLVLLRAKGVDLEDSEEDMKRRHGCFTPTALPF